MAEPGGRGVSETARRLRNGGGNVTILPRPRAGTSSEAAGGVKDGGWNEIDRRKEREKLQDANFGEMGDVKMLKAVEVAVSRLMHAVVF